MDFMPPSCLDQEGIVHLIQPSEAVLLPGLSIRQAREDKEIDEDQTDQDYFDIDENYSLGKLV